MTLRWIVALAIWATPGLAGAPPTPAGTPASAPVGAPEFAPEDHCLVVRELGGKELLREGAPSCADEPLGPCSTYKVPHAVLGLDSGVLAGPEATYAWDGTDQYFDAWERDHDLGSALKHSVVWYFQRLATDVGAERTQAFLDRIEYGNADISAGLTTYWLGTSLEVTVEQQLRFLQRLYRDELPVKPEAMSTVRELIVYEEGPGWAVSGKTGTCRPDDAPGHGWYVGHLQTGDRELVFASWQRNDTNPWGRDVRDDVLTRLRAEGWMPTEPHPTDPPTAGPSPPPPPAP